MSGRIFCGNRKPIFPENALSEVHIAFGDQSRDVAYIVAADLRRLSRRSLTHGECDHSRRDLRDQRPEQVPAAVSQSARYDFPVIAHVAHGACSILAAV